MKTTLAATLSTLALIGAAQAADLGIKKPTAIPVMASYNWSGFYVGAHAGYSFGEQRTRLGLGGSWAAEAATLRNEFSNGGGGTLRPGSFIGGFQTGYNHQMGNLVLGGEIDASFLDLRKRTNNQIAYSVAPALTYNFRRGVDTDWLVTIRPRLGYAFDRTLIYATGGLALAQVKDTWSVASSGNYLKAMSNSSVRVGWTLGAGVEHAFARNWTAKLEYLYTDLGRASKTSSYLAGSAFAPPGSNYTEQVKTRFTFHTVRVGVNYKF